MMSVGRYFGVIGSAYLLGSIPTGFLFGRAHGIDIRKVGSGNIGATNVMRALGKKWGILVLVLDALKGFVPVFYAPRCVPGLDPTRVEILACLAVIAGHNWTCWLKFKGGKGIATSAGALLAFLPGPLLCGLGVWGLVFAIWRYVSLASIAAALTVPVAAWLLQRTQGTVGFAAVLALVAVWKHRPNIRRLMAGTENRVGSKPLPVASEPSRGPGGER
jgi:glycerol-3-phosphate acyltransferase PlsY